MVIQWESQCPLVDKGADHLCCVSIVTNHLTLWQTILIFFYRFYLIVILRPCQQNCPHFVLIDPCRTKYWPLTFSSITTKWHRVDRSNYTYSESVSQEESVGMVFDYIETTFEFDTCTNYIVTPWLTVQKVTRQQYEIPIHGPKPT